MSDPLEVQIAAEKINKYATSESGDTVEVVERPRGGVSIVVADGLVVSDESGYEKLNPRDLSW